MRSMANVQAPELVLAAAEPYPILGATAQWCSMMGVSEMDIKGCGFKAFDADFRPLTKSKMAEFGAKDDLSPVVTAGMKTAVEQRRAVYVGATLELSAERAAECSCPPTRQVSLKIEPVMEASETSLNSRKDPPSQLRVTLQEQNMYTMKDAMSALTSGRATVMSDVNGPYRITNVSKTWKEVFGLEEAESVGRSLKMIEGPLTQQTELLSLYEAVASGVSAQCRLTAYNMDGRPHTNHVRVVPVQGDGAALPQASPSKAGAAQKLKAHCAAAAAAGVTHCLWYMEAHEVLMEKEAMASSLHAKAPKILFAPQAPFTILDVSDEWCSACQLPRDAVLGKALAEVHAAAGLAKGVCEAAEMKSTWSCMVDCRGDGTPFVNRMKTVPVLSASGELAACVGIVHQSMSASLTSAVEEGAMAAVVVSAAYPHTVVHANSAWLGKMLPEHMRMQQLHSLAAVVGTPLSAMALVSPDRDCNGRECVESDDLMKLTKGGAATRVLVAQHDALTGCGSWQQASLAPVHEARGSKLVTHLVISLDPSLAPSSAGAAKHAVPMLSGLLRRSCEDPESRCTLLLNCSDDEDEDAEPYALGETRNMSAGILRRTCESPVMAPEACGAGSGLPILKRSCEEPERRGFDDVELGSTSSDEEEYMDSEQEQELIGNRLPQEEVARALAQYMAQCDHDSEDEDEDERREVQGANPTQQYAQGGHESVSALKERTRRLSDRELLQAIRSHSQGGEAQDVCDDEASSDADDESTDDLQDGDDDEEDIVLMPKKARTCDGGHRTALESGRSNGADDESSTARYRDEHGELWTNSEVFTSVRVHVPEGEAIAPIFDEYLRVLRAKCLVESWSWPDDDTLSLQVPFGRVEKATSKSAWCAAFAPDLSSAKAWWLRLRYLVAAIQVHALLPAPAPPLPLPASVAKLAAAPARKTFVWAKST